MITDADIKKMRDVFATKTDLEAFATKKDLAVVAVDVAGLKADVAELKVDSSLLQQTVQRLEQGQERLETKIDKVLTIVQGFAGNVADLEQESRMGAITLRRHDIQIHELAHATSTAISE